MGHRVTCHNYITLISYGGTTNNWVMLGMYFDVFWMAHGLWLQTRPQSTCEKLWGGHQSHRGSLLPACFLRKSPWCLVPRLFGPKKLLMFRLEADISREAGSSFRLKNFDAHPVANMISPCTKPLEIHEGTIVFHGISSGRKHLPDMDFGRKLGFSARHLAGIGR